MAIELIKETFKVEELLGTNENQVLVETEIYLNPSGPTLEKVLWVQGKADILNTKIIKDKLIVSGLVKCNLLYKSPDEENNIHILESTKEFREELEVWGADEDMISKVKSSIDYIEWDLEEGMILLKALVNLQGEVREFKTIETIKEIVGGDDLQIKEENVNYKEVIAREISYVTVKDVLRLDDNAPEIDEIIKFNLTTREIETMVVDDRMITSSEVLVNLIYNGGGKIHSQKGVFPFNHFIEMPGVNADLKGQLELEVVEGLYNIIGNEDEERRLVDLEIKLRATGKVYENKSRDLIVDAYSTKENVLLEREEIRINESLRDFRYVENIDIEVSDIDASEILMIDGRVNLLEKRLTDESIVIDGVLALDIQYIDRISEELNSHKLDFPFRSNVYEHEEEADLLEIEANLDELDYNLRRDALGISGKVRMDINLGRNKKIYSIREIKETNEAIDKKNKPSITIYFVQKNDDLWDIAKRYNTTIEQILLSNNTTELHPGDKIIIEKMVEDVAV